MRWRRVAGLAAVSIGVAVPLAVVALPFAARTFVRGVVLMLNACLWLAMSISTGVSLWTVLGQVGRTTIGALATPAASAILIGLVAVGAVALYTLQRLLGTEEGESVE
jgi:hypothetical protein